MLARLKSEGNLTEVSKTIFALMGLVIIIAGMKAASGLLVPLLLSIFISSIAITPLHWMINLGIPRTMAALLSVGMVLLTLASLLTIIGASLGDFNGLIPHYEEKLLGLIASITAWLSSQGLSISKTVLLDLLNPAEIMNYAGNTFKTLSNLLSSSFLILLLVTFILMEIAYLPSKLKLLATSNDDFPHLKKFQEDLNKYLVIKTLVSLTTGIVVWIMLLIIGIDFALLWGVLAFLLNYIPNIGSLIAAVPPTLLALIDTGFASAIAVIVGYFVINNVFGNFIEPKLMGRSLGLSILVIFISLIFWGWVFGPVGMLLSIPLTMILKIGLEAQENTQWIAILLSDQKQLVEFTTSNIEFGSVTPALSQKSD